MPLKLIPPRAGRSPNWRIRGTYLGVGLDRSAGTPDKAVARRLLRQCEREIERGELSGRPELTFAAAALAYLNAGGEARFLKPVTDHFGPRTLAREIGQIEIDAAAVALYPDATPATRNRQVYSPVSAILRHVGIKLELRRPKGARGRQLLHWLTPEQARAALAAAREVDAEFAAFLILLLYTGARLSDALDHARWSRIDLAAALWFVPDTKNDDPRAVHLPPDAVAALANLTRVKGRDHCFRFRKNGRLYQLLKLTSERCGLKLGFHLLCHTWATWMRRDAGLSVDDLVKTGRWRDPQSANRYAHVEIADIARRANLLPSISAGAPRARSVVHGKKGRSTR